MSGSLCFPPVGAPLLFAMWHLILQSVKPASLHEGLRAAFQEHKGRSCTMSLPSLSFCCSKKVTGSVSIQRSKKQTLPWCKECEATFLPQPLIRYFYSQQSSRLGTLLPGYLLYYLAQYLLFIFTLIFIPQNLKVIMYYILVKG